MRDVLFYATERHYVDHLAPIAGALIRRPFRDVTVSLAAGSRDAYHRFCAYGLDPSLARRLAPLGRRRGPRGRRQQRATAEAPLVVVASYGDYRRAKAVGPVVLVEHGAGQTYVGTDPDLPYHPGGQGRDDVVTFICPNATVAAVNAARYPGVPSVAVGSPRLEALAAARARHAAARLHPSTGGRPLVVFSTHWDCHVAPEARWAFPHYRPALDGLAAADRWRFAGHGHPRAWADLNEVYARAGIARIRSFDDVASTADVYVVDNSSTLFEAVALGLRVVVLDAPWYRRDVDHGLRFWRWADVGPRCAEPDEVADAVAAALDDGDRWGEVRAACADEVYGPLAGSIERAVEAVLAASALA